jgi:hypothetical protein
MNVIASYKERVKSIFTKKPDYQALYRKEQKEAEKWEYKHNKLYRQLNAILKESE